MKIENKDLSKKIKDVMTKNVITISQEAPLEDAKKLMISKQFNCLPVVRNNELLGIITTKDL